MIKVRGRAESTSNLIREFVGESKLGFPAKVKLDTRARCTPIKRRFEVEYNGVLMGGRAIDSNLDSVRLRGYE